MTAASINDFVIRFANVNGTGSASANGLVAKCLFRMGLIIGPKNMFPSNIQGMPTWYEIRVCARGFTGRRGGVDLMVAMNALTLAQDSRDVVAGGYLLYDSTRPLAAGQEQSGVTYLPLPLTELARGPFSNPRQRGLLQNMIYVGALTALLQLDQSIVEDLITQQYQSRPKLIPLNLQAFMIGLQYAQTHFNCPLPFYGVATKLSGPAADAIMLDGNRALALGCLYAGATVCGWYPITPSTSVVEAFSAYCHKLRVDAASGEKSFAIVQAEDEIAALGIVLGAAWMGARSFTATSGPGISLMNELLGFAYYAEIPTVLFNIQRCGPSTGMPTRNQQSDLLLCAYASHGDTKHLLLFPSNPHECFDFAVQAFDLAEKYQTPVMVLSDLEIGMNEYRSPALSWDDSYQAERGKVLGHDELEALSGPFHRYVDSAGDGIPSRTYPGVHAKGAYFTRGSGHDKWGRYTEDGALYMENLDRIARKFITAVNDDLPKPVITQASSGRGVAALVYYGSTDEALSEACAILADEGFALDRMRVRAFPFGGEVSAFMAAYERVLVIEQNRDGQLRKLLLAEEAANARGLISVLHYDGLPLEAVGLASKIKEQLQV